MIIPSVYALDSPAATPSAQTVLTSNIPLTSTWQNILQGLFKLPAGTPLTLQSAIILGVLFIVIFFIINDLAKLIPFFEGKPKSFIAAIIITLLVAVSGGMYESLMFLLSISNLISGLGSLGWLGFVAVILILIIAGFVLGIGLRAMKKTLRTEEMENAGYKLGKDSALAMAYNKSIRKGS